MVASIASPTIGTNTNGIMRVNMTITLPARFRFDESKADLGRASRGLEYRIRISASKERFHQIYRLTGLVTVRAILQRRRQQVERGHVRRVNHVFGDGNCVLFGGVQIRGSRRAEIAGPQA